MNPVLREGNSDRRAPASVKNYARKHPHSMGAWSADSKTNVATMDADDFRHNEQSVVIAEDGALTIRLQPAAGGEPVVLREGIPVTRDEIVDATVMRAAALDAFLADQVARAQAEDVLFSVHLKATMMKVSDPVVFGHVVRAYFATSSPPTATSSPLPASTAATGWARSSPGSATSSTAARSGPPSSSVSPRARSSPWSTPTRGSPTSTSRATSSSTPRCRR